MKKVIYLMALCCISFGCTLEEPCEDDELYSTDGKCIKCIAQAMPGYHLEDGHCVKDSDKSCGDLKKDCQNLADKGVELAECREGECIPTSCKKDLGYKLVDNTCVFSIPDSSFECGMEPNVHNCMQKGVKTADCVKLEGAPEDSLLRICRVSDCWPGYHRVENIDDNNDWMPFTCEEDTSEKCGEGKVNCLDGEGIADAICLNGSCQILSCKADEGYKLKDNGCRISISDFPYECGVAPNVHNCMHDGVADNGVGCVRDPNDLDDSLKRICSVSECLTGYHLVVNEDSDKDWLPKKCELDTSEKCGSGVNGPINCLDGDGIVDAVCGGGRCLIQSCDEKEGYKLKDNKCELAVFELPEKCGLQTDTADPHNCMQDGVQTAICSKDLVEFTNLKKRICLVTNCKPRFHQVDNIGEDSDWMPSVCELDTEEKCGGSSENNNCHKLFGADIVSCELGQCVIKTCDAKSGYEKDDQGRCILPETRACGQSKTDCVKDWLEDVYHNTEQQNASTPVCDKGQCSLNYCAPTYIKVSCSEYNKYYANGKTIAGCRDKITDSVCIKDPCPRVVNKTADDDYDGVINCFDACPFNPTKSDKALWLDEAGANGVRCDILDTDLDGIDDSEDVCPTREGKQTFNQFDRSELEDAGLCKNSKCPESAVGLNELQIAKLCGLYIEQDIPEFHIYNAKDFETLAILLADIHNRYSCDGNYVRCNLNINRYEVCVDGVAYSEKCSSCKYSDDVLKCGNVEVAEFKNIGIQLKIYLDNDINLDDNIESFFVNSVSAVNGPTGGNNYEEDVTAYGIWKPIPFLMAADFDGQNHVIRYYRHRPELRGKIMQSLFGEVILSNIHNLKLDFDMKGYGQGLFAASLVSSSLENVEVVGGVLESSYVGNGGVGLLCGNINETQGVPVAIRNITISGSVIAPNADHVGGLAGIVNASSNIENDDFTFSNIEITLDALMGYNRVGGLVGLPKRGLYDSISVDTNEVVGHNYVGGLFGSITSDSDVRFLSPVVFVNNNKIEGHDYIGGAIGYVNCNGNNACLNLNANVTNNSVVGNDYVGGLIGSALQLLQNNYVIKNQNVSGHNYVGGCYGRSSLGDIRGIVQNATMNVSGEGCVGGFSGSTDGGCGFNEDESTCSGKTGAEYQFCNQCGRDYWLYNFVNSVNHIGVNNTGNGGNGGIGGVGGCVDGYNYRMGNIYSVVKSVNGGNGSRVGGYIGTDSSYTESITGNVYNYVETVVGDSYVGGFIGCGDNSKNSEINVLNKVEYIHAKKNTGGFCGGFGEWLKLQNVYSAIVDISTEEGTVGGIANVYSEWATSNIELNNLHSQINNITGGGYSTAGIHVGSVANMFKLANVSVMANFNSLDGDINTAGVISGLSQYSSSSSELGKIQINSVFSAVSMYRNGRRSCSQLFGNSDKPIPLYDYIEYGSEIPYSDASLYVFSNCEEGRPWYDNSSVNVVRDLSKLYNILIGWGITSFVFDSSLEEMPVVFTEEDFLKKLPVPNESIISELQAWLLSME